MGQALRGSSILRGAGFSQSRHSPWMSSEALCSPVFSFPVLVASLSCPLLGESWVEQWELGTARGGEEGWEKESHCYRYLSLSAPFFSLTGDQRQWARQRGFVALSFVFQRTRGVSALWLETWSFRQCIWSFSGLLILKTTLFPSVKIFLLLSFPMTSWGSGTEKLLVSSLFSSVPSWPCGASRGQPPWLNSARGRWNWSPKYPLLWLCGIL